MENDNINSFYIRYGPAVIFSNVVPALDVNFINPKYTENNPYEVMITPGYIEDNVKKELIKDTSNKNLTDLKQNFEQVIGKGSINEGEISITLASDDNKNNEWQMLITYENDCMIVEGGQNNIAKDLSNLLAGTVGEGTDTHIEVMNFAELKGKCTSGSDWEKTINKMLKKGNISWAARAADVNYSEKEYEYKEVTTNEITQKINVILADNGYNEATTKSNYGTTYSWMVNNENGCTHYNLKTTATTSSKDRTKVDLKITLEQADLASSATTGKTMVSSSYTLQKTIATWYNALRAIALVGLLSVLVYIGIRILISSTGQEKAKYKKMISDWVAAICILFILQYIMAFIVDITEKISNILKTNLIGSQGEDILMSNLRSTVGISEDFEVIFPQLIMYLVLVIYTIMFTIQYVKRVIYMGFFTMIAPLIALTYPLDKIKDGQAQAFTIWLREYIFNALLQPIHLLIYYIFVGSAMDLSTTNPIYAIIVIGFMLPAEKFFRKMFGFDKSTSTSQLGAAAGGALVMNAINKMGQRAGQHAAGKSGGGTNNVGSGAAPSTSNRFIGAPSKGDIIQNESSGGVAKSSKFGPKDILGGHVKGAGATGSFNLKNGVRTLSGNYFNRGNFGKQGKVWKAAGRGIRKGLVGAAGAATLGTVGLAAGVATGDFSKAMQYGAAGAGAGFMGANAIGDRLTGLEKKNRELIMEGGLGTAEYNTRNSIKELTNNNDFNRICKDMEIDEQEERENLIRQFYKNGITKAEDINKAMTAARSTPGSSHQEAILLAQLKKEAEKYGMKKKDIRESLVQRGVPEKSKELDRMMSIMDQL